MSSQDLRIEYRSLSELQPYARNARTHSKKQIRQIAESIQRFGFTNPILVSDEGLILAGHGRAEAAKLAGLAEVPTIAISHLKGAERRALTLADNKLALNAGWNLDLLASELEELIDLDFDLESTGFSLAEVDFHLDAARDRSTKGGPDDADRIQALQDVPVTRPGDIWFLGGHRLICGDARDASVLEQLLGDEQVDLIFTDPPYNVRIDGHVCGSGKIHHREFAMASGEMSQADFTQFLIDALQPAAAACRDGAITFVCMDWRHMDEMLKASKAVFSELKNLCVWNKTNGGMGTFYRSKHELVFVFKVGSAAHINNFGLGDTGRYRTNVWDYAGVNSVGESRRDLELHPTVKPVALIVDAIEDCSRRKGIVLDMFGGSGSTLIAAERCGRRARLIELDPLYCDTIVRRFETITGKVATLEGSSGESFEDIALARSAESGQ